MRVNEKYLQEMCVNLTQKEMIEYDIFKAIDDENRKVYLDTIKRAIETEEKQQYTAVLDSERRFKMASEQANIYYWEYSIAERAMRPCFRCMRDLGFPAVLTNYPESAIERGVFPPEVAEMYIDWHRQIAEGVPSLEAVIPLTPDRIPFRVKYTTEYDDFGNAAKAYGSATLIVE